MTDCRQTYLTLDAESRVELGCGPKKLHPDALAVDALDLEGVDLVGPIPEVLNSLPSASVDVVFSSHFLEHLDDVSSTIAECARILKPGGRLITAVPHFSNPYYFSDPTHRTSFGLYSMSYFCHDSIHRRVVPKYVDDSSSLDFELLRADYQFNRNWILKGAIASLCKRSVRFKELFEQRGTALIPVAELQFDMRRT